jgi:diguanylate cyclase (GGDEF)-like protein/PAS domain S-box-containing protein
MESRRRDDAFLGAGLVVLVVVSAAMLLAVAQMVRVPDGPAEGPPGAVSTAFLVAAGAVVLLLSVASIVYAGRERRRRARIEERLSRMTQTAEQAGDLFTIVNRSGRIEYVNPAVERVTGWSRQELIGRRSDPWLPWYESERLFEDVRGVVLEGGSFSGTVSCRRKDGAPFKLQEQVSALRDDSGRITRLVSTASDVTREKRLEERLQFLRARDATTGLANRRTFLAELDARLRDDRPVTVMVMDVDRFKYINDVFGPATGDEVLRRIGRALGDAAGKHDLVARLGSDEFGLIHVDEGRLSETEAVAERVRGAVPGTFSVGGQDVVATLTAGIARSPGHGRDASSLVRHAGMALAEARALGRNGAVVFSPDLSQRISGAYSLERNLAGALAHGEFEVDYQPYCDLSSGRIGGAEALLRWHSPELGVVSPSIFIPSLEETGAIIEVGEWVLRSACHQLKEWEGREQPVGLAVNLSQVQFRNRDLVGLVSDALSEAAIDPALLTLELTESVCVRDLDLAAGVLKRLKDVGVSLSVDDFGTGYSSLSYIRKLPVDTLKIDQAFVREVARDPDAASIISAITGMARSLGLRTIAEGVEQEDQRNVLHLLRCDLGQGYLFSPAVPAPDFERYCARAPASPPAGADA